MLHDYALDDIDELYWETPGWDFDYLQLTAGMLGFQSRVVQLPGLQIEWNTYGQRMLLRDSLLQEDIVFGVVLEANTAPRYLGHEINCFEGFVYQPHKENNYVLHPGTRTLNLTIESKLAQTLGWHLTRHSVRSIPQELHGSLLAICEEVANYFSTPAASFSDSMTEFALRDRILSALHGALAPWLADDTKQTTASKNPDAMYQLTKQAVNLMSRLDPLDKLKIGHLARELDVSERTLYNAFQGFLGIGPYEYHIIRRLHSFRDELLLGNLYHGKITDAALVHGFHHLGRLTQNFRRHFGETPRQTIKRWAEICQ